MKMKIKKIATFKKFGIALISVSICFLIPKLEGHMS